MLFDNELLIGFGDKSLSLIRSNAIWVVCVDDNCAIYEIHEILKGFANIDSFHILFRNVIVGHVILILLLLSLILILLLTLLLLPASLLLLLLMILI